MNKYDILEGKLTAINAYIDTMCLESNATMEYLKQALILPSCGKISCFNKKLRTGVNTFHRKTLKRVFVPI